MAKHAYRKILLLCESSKEGMAAGRDAIALAADEDAVLVVAAVVDTAVLRQLLTYRIFVQEEMEEYEEELRVSAQKQIDYIRSLARAAKVECQCAVLAGATHSAVLAEQERSGADLLVMGAFRASTASRDITAREKQLILDEMPCPVLLVR